MDLISNNGNDSNFDNDMSMGTDDNDYHGDVLLGAADTSSKDKSLRWVCLLCAVLRTNGDCGLGQMTSVLGWSANSLARFNAVELKALTFFVYYFLLCIEESFEEGPPICFCCPSWNLTVLFL
jgi:hypothetical protein